MSRKLATCVLWGLLAALSARAAPPVSPATTELRIGFIAPLSGVVPSFGAEVRNGVLLAVQQWNDRGGIGGRRIQAVIGDGQCTAAKGVEAARKLIFEDKVRYLIGESCSSASIPISEIANAAQVIQITPGSTNPRVTIDSSGKVKPFIFRACYVDPYQGGAAAKFAYDQLAARRAFLLGDPTNDYVSGLRNAFEFAFIKFGGKIVGKADYTPDREDFSALLSEVKAAKPDLIYLPDYYSTVNLILRQAREIGITAPFVGGDGWDSEDLDLQIAEGSYFVNHFSDQDPSPEVAAFLQAYERAFPNAERAVGIPHMLAALAYDAANLLLQAIEQAGDDPNRVREALESIRFHGATGDLRFDASHNPMKTAFMLGIRKQAVQFVDRVAPVTLWSSAEKAQTIYHPADSEAAAMITRTERATDEDGNLLRLIHYFSEKQSSESGVAMQADIYNGLDHPTRFIMTFTEAVQEERGFLRRVDIVDQADKLLGVRFELNESEGFLATEKEVQDMERFPFYCMGSYLKKYHEAVDKPGNYNIEAPVFAGTSYAQFINSVQAIGAEELVLIENWCKMHKAEGMEKLYESKLQVREKDSTLWVCVQEKLPQYLHQGDKMVLQYYYIGSSHDGPTILVAYVRLTSS